MVIQYTKRFKSTAGIIFFLLTVIVLSDFAAGQPFQQNIIEQGSLDIVYPKNPAFKQGEAFKLNFHVFNSTGYQVLPANLGCLVHVYGPTNRHIIEERANKTGDEFDVFININNTVSQVSGIYPYIVFCNSTSNGNQNGYLSHHFEITQDGKLYQETGFSVAMAILFIGVMFFLLYLSKQINTRDEKNNPLPSGLIIQTVLIFTAAFMSFVGIQTALGVSLGLAPYISQNTMSVYQFAVVAFPALGVVALLSLLFSFLLSFAGWIARAARLRK